MNGRQAGEPGRGSLVTVAEVLADPELSRPPEAVIPRLAYRSRVSMLASREKLGKTTLVAAGAATVSTGGAFLGEQSAEGCVLWVGPEEALGDQANRLNDFGCDPERVYILDRVTDPVADVWAAIEQTRPVLIVIDTLASLVSTLDLDPGSSAAWTPIMAGFCRMARDSGAAVLLIHHARKSDGAYRDSSAIGAGVDLILEMGAEAGGGTVRKVRGRGRWRVDDFAVQLEGEHWALVAGELSLETLVYLYVERNPGASLRAVRAGVQGKARLVDDALRRLEARGAIENTGVSQGHEYRVPGHGLGHGGVSP
jgi:hypothetical protein